MILSCQCHLSCELIIIHFHSHQKYGWPSTFQAVQLFTHRLAQLADPTLQRAVSASGAAPRKLHGLRQAVAGEEPKAWIVALGVIAGWYMISWLYHEPSETLMVVFVCVRPNVPCELSHLWVLARLEVSWLPIQCLAFFNKSWIEQWLSSMKWIPRDMCVVAWCH